MLEKEVTACTVSHPYCLCLQLSNQQKKLNYFRLDIFNFFAISTSRFTRVRIIPPVAMMSWCSAVRKHGKPTFRCTFHSLCWHVSDFRAKSSYSSCLTFSNENVTKLIFVQLDTKYPGRAWAAHFKDFLFCIAVSSTMSLHNMVCWLHGTCQ